MCEVAKIVEKPNRKGMHEGSAANLSDSLWKEMQHGTSSKAEKPAAKEGSIEMTDPYKTKCGPMNFDPSVLEQSKPGLTAQREQVESSRYQQQPNGYAKPAYDRNLDAQINSLDDIERKSKDPVVQNFVEGTKEKLAELGISSTRYQGNYKPGKTQY